jgi:hypothetical protein
MVEKFSFNYFTIYLGICFRHSSVNCLSVSLEGKNKLRPCEKSSHFSRTINEHEVK